LGPGLGRVMLLNVPVPWTYLSRLAEAALVRVPHRHIGHVVEEAPHSLPLSPTPAVKCVSA
jgi:hypothetical protein